METVITGSALVLGDNIDTDQIYPGRFLELVDPQEIGSHCLAGVSPDIAPNFVKGGILVAGRNFGCGSSREHAPIALLAMGASLVLADSFARIFFRNAINLGLPLVTCAGISGKIRSGQLLTADIANGVVTLPGAGATLPCDAIGSHALSILAAGGIKPLFRAKYGV